VLAQMMLKPDLWKPPPSLETTFAWLDKFVSKRKVETLSVALDEFIRMEQEYFDDEDAMRRATNSEKI